MVRITVRLPEKLHSVLTKAAEAGSRPLNREIISRLEASFLNEMVDGSKIDEVESAIDLAEKRLKSVRQTLDRLIKESEEIESLNVKLNELGKR